MPIWPKEFAINSVTKDNHTKGFCNFFSSIGFGKLECLDPSENWSFGDLAFSKLSLKRLTRNQICDLQHQANEPGALNMERSL